ncbi:hypothetical protein [Methylobacterium sp. JK268]
MSRRAWFAEVRNRLRRGGDTLLLVLGLSAGLLAASPLDAAPLRIGDSDWPGWVAWQVAIDKAGLKEAAIDATFAWFDSSAPTTSTRRSTSSTGSSCSRRIRAR